MRLCASQCLNRVADNEHRSAAWVLSRFIHRRAGLIVAVTLCLCVVALWMASQLRIDQELRRLLPDDFPSVTRLDRLSGRLGQQSDLYVAIRSPSRDANIEFGTKVAAAVADRDDIRYAVFRRDLSYFDQNALLYAPTGDLLDLRRRVILRIRDEVRKEAFGDFSLRDPKPDEENDLTFSIDEMLEEYGLSEASSEFMEADEGRLMVVKMRPVRAATDLEFARKLTADVARIVEELDPQAHHLEMTTELNGSYVQHQRRLESVQQEVWGGSAAALVALLLTLGVYFRSPRAVVLIMLPLLVSIVGALAFAWLAFDVLNIVSAFIFAVLLGLGIDFGIHVLARLRQERGRGASSEDALALCLSTSGRTTVAGAASTALAFAALSVADFQGFAQFGQVAAVGVVLSVAGACLVMPAIAVLLDRLRPWTPPAPPKRSGRKGVPGWMRLFAIVVAIGGIAVAGWAGSRVTDLEYEHDLKKLGRKRSPAQGPKSASYRDAVGTYQTVDPAIALVETAADARSIQRQLDALLAMTPEEIRAFDPSERPGRRLEALPDDTFPQRPKLDGIGLSSGPKKPDLPQDDWAEDDEWDAEGEAAADEAFMALHNGAFNELEVRTAHNALMSPRTADALGEYGAQRLLRMRGRLARVWSVHAFVPRQQDDKLRIIADIRQRIAAKEGLMSAEARAQIDQWRGYLEVTEAVDVEHLPGWVRSQFEDADGDPGKLVVISTRGSKADIHNSREIYQVFGTVYAQGRWHEVAADFFVIPEIFDAIDRDGPYVLQLAIGIMVLTALVLLRRFKAALAVVVTVAFSLLWLVAVFFVLDWKLNFFNIIVLPLLLGMGQDDALHLAERHREEDGSMGIVLREAGGAIFVTTLTTVLGFSGILFANHLGLHSMAWTAVIGMTLALVASVVVLPLLLALLHGRPRPATCDTPVSPE